MTPETVRAWQRVLRDFMILAVAVFMLVFGTVAISDPQGRLIVLGAGLSAAGLPPLLRAGEWWRPNGKGGGSDDGGS